MALCLGCAENLCRMTVYLARQGFPSIYHGAYFSFDFELKFEGGR